MFDVIMTLLWQAQCGTEIAEYLRSQPKPGAGGGRAPSTPSSHGQIYGGGPIPRPP